MAGNVVTRYENVVKSYGALTVVKGLNLEVRRGEFLSLLGPSGSGKTTTLMMLAGLETPTSGRILLDGVSIEGIPPHRRNIGVVFQNYALFPHMTVAENLAYPLKARRMARPEIGSRVQRALEIVKLESLAERRPAQLSGGQQQRVALARALVFEPSVVLLDEPLGALDRQLRETMQLELKQLHSETSVTMIYVTHDQGEAMTMSDRVAVFHDGNLLQCAPPKQLYDEPESAFVAEFVGENNRLSGTLVSRDGEQGSIKTDAGMMVASRLSSKVRIGDQVLLYVRPERASIGVAAGTCENRFEARVVDTIFQGDHTRLRLDFPASSHFTVKQNFFADTGPPAVGDRVRLGWSAQALQVVQA
ncbi:ABC transporter ATP-binding protein [Shinella yambaruensis]|uniref:Spermidine/putrescine import ATP-binding protein PotA n=1 Tax=Shinella yambaruensis TaxID=415996 RepID=A0ABQ5ZSZ0_9HYPH|nr:ABC transporter ATP-binding protein [Shinella yambaruensis]MCJ8028831.1 ABC transporter ATP-binding protein [Shinella yambaruensis]MCU7981887.1 ABC transporter ATP-binding protein [Shinella yambaruensis]GLR54857.1 polyamine-transporting ATPase [Shinella yambaruensis]